jgi:hypothetical protein
MYNLLVIGFDDKMVNLKCRVQHPLEKIEQKRRRREVEIARFARYKKVPGARPILCFSYLPRNSLGILY